MIHQRQKDLLLLMISKASVLNHGYRKYVSPWKDRNGKGVHLNLGCGDKYCDYFRVLKSDAGMRIVVPSLENAIAAYSVRKLQWFSDWPRSNRSIGGRFSNFIFCDGQHRNAFDFEYMSEMLLGAGFCVVEKSRPGASRLYPPEALAPSENDPQDPPACLYMEVFR